MSKVTLDDLANLQNETSAVNTINSNSAVIETAFDNTLSRNGTSPNQMGAALDMNSNQIINLPSPSTVNSPARLIDVTTNPTIVIPGTGTSGHVVPYLDGVNTWSGAQTFSAGISGDTSVSGVVTATKYAIGSEVILTHPLTPSPDNDARTNITLGAFAGASLVPIHSTQYLTLLGFNAGNSLTTADHITAIGAFALEHYTVNTSTPPTSPSITAIGVDSCRQLTTGEGLTAIGEHTMTNATTIKNSVAVGNNAMLQAGGERNTAVGVGALQGATTANDNTAIGYGAMAAVTALAASNTALGAFALGSLTSGTNNFAVGHTAGLNVTTGTFNTIVGDGAGATLTTGSQNILIGLNADVPTASTSQFIQIGPFLKGTILDLVSPSGLTVANLTAVPAGGATSIGVKISSTSNLGFFVGSGVPTMSAAQGSVYTRTDGSSTSTRMYVNTNGTTGWTNVTTAT